MELFLSFSVIYSVWNIQVTYNRDSVLIRTLWGFVVVVVVTVCCRYKKSIFLHWYLRRGFTSVHGKYRSP